MIIIKSDGDAEKLRRILDIMENNIEEFVILSTLDPGTDSWESLYLDVYSMGGVLVHTKDDWLWVTDDNWDGDLSGIVGIGSPRSDDP